MSQSIEVLDKSFVANANLSAYQFRFVKQGTDERVTYCIAATDKSVAILQDDPGAAGDNCSCRLVGTSKLVAGAQFAVGKLLVSDSTGRGITCSGTGQYVGAIALEAAAAANNVVEVLKVNFVSVASDA